MNQELMVGDRILHNKTGNIATIEDIFTGGETIWMDTVTIRQYPFEPTTISLATLNAYLTDPYPEYIIIKSEHFNDELFTL